MIPEPVKQTIGKGTLPELGELPSDLRPVPGRVFVELDEVQEKTAGGLFLPDTARDLQVQNTAWTAKVLRVSKEHDAEEAGWGEGDTIVLALTYDDIKGGGRGTTVVREEVIMGVLEP